MRISDWSSDVCSSDLQHPLQVKKGGGNLLSTLLIECGEWHSRMRWTLSGELRSRFRTLIHLLHQWWISRFPAGFRQSIVGQRSKEGRSEEHTSELQSLMRISYAVFCLKKKTMKTNR